MPMERHMLQLCCDIPAVPENPLKPSKVPQKREEEMLLLIVRARILLL